jgi:hypothetical protein
MGQIPEDPARTGAASDICHECVQESQRPWPDYAKIQALATLSLAETLQEVAEFSRRILLGGKTLTPRGSAGLNPSNQGAAALNPDGPLRVRCAGGGALAPPLSTGTRPGPRVCAQSRRHTLPTAAPLPGHPHVYVNPGGAEGAWLDLAGLRIQALLLLHEQPRP